jgi:DNA-binding CsgD family transcriptional regulator
MMAFATREGQSTWHAHFLCSLLLNLASSSEEPATVADDAAHFADTHPIFRNRFQAESALVFALLDLDRWEEARARAELHLRVAPDDQARVFAAAALAEVAWLSGDDTAVDDACAVARSLGEVWWGTRAVAEVIAAHVAHEAGVPFEPDLPGFTLPAMAPASREVAALQLAQHGDVDGAIAALDAVVEDWETIGTWRWSVRAQAAAARLARRAARDDAVSREHRVLRIATEHGIAHHLRRWERGRAGDQLTGREREVLDLVAAGMTSSQIARQLNIAVGTVDDHIERARQKLGMPTRRAAARRTAV